jgi:hypothetical protein
MNTAPPVHSIYQIDELVHGRLNSSSNSAEAFFCASLLSCFTCFSSTSRRCAICASSERSKSNLRECVIDSSEFAALTCGHWRSTMEFLGAVQEGGLPSTRHAIPLEKIPGRCETCPCLRSSTSSGSLPCTDAVGERTEARLTMSTMPSTSTSTSASNFLFHSSSMLSRYSSEFWSTSAVTTLR